MLSTIQILSNNEFMKNSCHLDLLLLVATVSGALRHNLPKAYDAAIIKSLQDSCHVTIQLVHRTLNRKKIILPQEAPWMKYDIVATKNNKSR